MQICDTIALLSPWEDLGLAVKPTGKVDKILFAISMQTDS